MHTRSVSVTRKSCTPCGLSVCAFPVRFPPTPSFPRCPPKMQLCGRSKDFFLEFATSLLMSAAPQAKDGLRGGERSRLCLRQGRFSGQLGLNSREHKRLPACVGGEEVGHLCAAHGGSPVLKVAAVESERRSPSGFDRGRRDLDLRQRQRGPAGARRCAGQAAADAAGAAGVWGLTRRARGLRQVYTSVDGRGMRLHVRP